MQLSVLPVHSLKLVARQLILHINYNEFLPNDWKMDSLKVMFVVFHVLGLHSPLAVHREAGKALLVFWYMVCSLLCPLFGHCIYSLFFVPN